MKLSKKGRRKKGLLVQRAGKPSSSWLKLIFLKTRGGDLDHPRGLSVSACRGPGDQLDLTTLFQILGKGKNKIKILEQYTPLSAGLFGMSLDVLGA